MRSSVISLLATAILLHSNFANANCSATPEGTGASYKGCNVVVDGRPASLPAVTEAGCGTFCMELQQERDLMSKALRRAATEKPDPNIPVSGSALTDMEKETHRILVNKVKVPNVADTIKTLEKLNATPADVKQGGLAIENGCGVNSELVGNPPHCAPVPTDIGMNPDQGKSLNEATSTAGVNGNAPTSGSAEKNY